MSGICWSILVAVQFSTLKFNVKKTLIIDRNIELVIWVWHWCYHHYKITETNPRTNPGRINAYLKLSQLSMKPSTVRDTNASLIEQVCTLLIQARYSVRTVITRSEGGASGRPQIQQSVSMPVFGDEWQRKRMLPGVCLGIRTYYFRYW